MTDKTNQKTADVGPSALSDGLGWFSADGLELALLWDWKDDTGAVDNLFVKLDPKHPQHDGGPEERLAWFDVPLQHFVCASSAAALPNVIGWRVAT